MDFKLFEEHVNKFFERFKIYICQSCDKMSTVSEHSGYHNHPYLNAFVHPFFPNPKNPVRHPNSYVLTNLNQLKGIGLDLLDFMDVLKECVNFVHPNTIPGKWNIYIEEIHIGKRNFYHGIFGNSEWKRYVKIDGDIISLFVIFVVILYTYFYYNIIYLLHHIYLLIDFYLNHYYYY